MKKGRMTAGAALAASLFLALLYGIFIYHSMGFIYAIADDIIMRDIASGAFTGTPDGHLIYVQYVLGAALSFFYQLCGQIDWYGFFMEGVILLGLAAVLYRGFSEDRPLVWKAVYTGISLGLFGCAMVFHMAQFEWTICAAMSGASALYLYATMQEGSRGKNILEGCFVWLLLFFTYGIRKDVFLMVFPGFGIAFLWKFIRKEGNRIRLHFGQLILPAAVFLTLGATFITEQQAYKGKGWEDFQRFQSARSDVYDYYGVPSYEANPAYFDERGLDTAQIRNLRHYALYLVEGMDAELMEQIETEAENQSSRQSTLEEKLKNGVVLAADQAADSEYFPVSIPLLLVLAGTVFLSVRNCRKSLFPLLLFLSAEGVLWLYLGFMGRLPERVAFSMHLVTLLGVCAVFFRLWRQKEETWGVRKAPVLLAAGLCVLAAAAFQWQNSRTANEEKLAMDENYQKFKLSCTENPENLYFIETFMAEPVGGARVSTEYSNVLNNCLTLGDWYTTSPLDEERLARLGISDVEETILSRDNVYLVVRDVEDPGFLADYFEEKYPGCSLVCREKKELEGRYYYLYQVEMR